ncbi:LacI family DNA-binding transcriptional regulator [Quadrisphaera setariae]|uniref:LacI family transcriptional regulator n=1 Tax=Quadrisphaera setariae TaxID=2593304 RepID=A0A5C8ZH54_9ACTN|nr:LacI family DNA-binding transcriptional regulator [Quadrisphaera setariae]TXR56568.1 LacI family transcriptional regulator [Quadrisphaera setariae]
MRDVAEAAGVSSMTVSNVLAGRSNVSEETRRRVLEVVERTGYRVNTAAQSLRRGRTGIIGLAVPEVDSHYFGLLASRLITRLASEGLRVVVEQTGASREGELAAITTSRVSAYDGLVLSAVGLDPDAVASLAGDLPVVVLGERQDVRRFDHVEMANTAGAAAVTRLLLDRGCRRLVALGMPDAEPLGDDDEDDDDRSGERTPGAQRPSDAFRLRALGVHRAVAEVPGARVTGLPALRSSLAAGAALAREALARDPDLDGLVCATDALAIGALRALADAGRRVPHDVLVTGFDDVEDAAYTVPSLTSVSPGHDVIVEETARLLLRRMADRGAPPESVVSPFVVVERESTQRS